MNNIFTKVILKAISIFIPTKRNLFIFGSWFSMKYGDNPKYFFEYLLKMKRKDIYWYTRNITLYYHLHKLGIPVIYGISIKNIFLHLRAQAVFCNCSPDSDLLGFAINRKTTVFNLWHGTPMKKIGNDAKKDIKNNKNLGVKSHKIENIIRRFIPKYIINILKPNTYFLASSNQVATNLISAFNLSSKNIIINGYPKLDSIISRHCLSPNNNILYSPTYRGEYNSIYDILTSNGFVAKSINSKLSALNYNLIIRLHPANKLPPPLISEIEKYSNIQLDDSNDDIYSTLDRYKLVITDFSSLYFDALAIKTNVVIAPFDISNYKKQDRGLYYDINKLFPFKKSYNWPQLVDNLDYYLNLNFSDFENLRDEFYPYDLHVDTSESLLKKIDLILG